MTLRMAASLGRFSTFALLAIAVPAAIVAVLGYVSLRQWERSAELLFREQARDMASMAAEKVVMMLRHAEDDLFQQLAQHVGAAAGDPAALDALVAGSPLVDRLYVCDRGGALLYPGAWRDDDARVFGTLRAEVPSALWERGGRRQIIVGDRVLVAAVLRLRDGAPVLAGLFRNVEALRREVLAKTLGGLEAPTIAAVLDHRDRTVYARTAVTGAEPVATVAFGDELPRWRVAMYAEPGRSPRDAIRRQVTIFTAAFGVLVAILVAGIAATWRLMRRETEMARLKADFVANVSHDLKTPLSVIRMFGETLEMGRLTSETQRQEYYRVITRETERLSRLIDNVLDFSRIEGGRRRYDMAPTVVEPLVRETVEAFAYPLAQGGFKVDVRVAAELGEVTMDADAVRQALANLVDNAIKYSADRRVLHVEAAIVGDHLAIGVEDEGIGVAPAEQSRIFEKFYRVGRSDTQGRRGSGVGLALVRHVAEAHGGRVTVKSEPGRGSRFTLWLPATPVVPASDDTEPDG
ncbi:MAG: HAMP domain-containing histidine kinase [Candidatus Rokubacteria bacterium]|nr:HAMP domain-containing histidine kinase [Candidatus Rokubacteria bacterium]